MKVYQSYFVSVDGAAEPIPQSDARQETALAACASWRDRACFIVCADVPDGLRRGDVPVIVANANEDALRSLLTRIAYKLRDLPPDVVPLNFQLHEELWAAVGNIGVIGANAEAHGRRSRTVQPLVGNLDREEA